MNRGSLLAMLTGIALAARVGVSHRGSPDFALTPGTFP
jgi:hypothetical protein